MSSADYWREREAETLGRYVKDEKAYAAELERIYQDMLDACQREIDRFYGKYAADEHISIAEAKRRISKADIAAFERKAAKYVRERNFSDQANAEMRLYNATMKINRLEMLKANIGLELISGHDEMEKFMAGILKNRTEEELQRQAGILGRTVRDNARQAGRIVNASFHNARFSDRIWMYQDALRADLGKLLQSGMIQGKNPRQLARELRRTFNASRYNAERLMRTELARVQTDAQRESFKRNGFTMYEFIANSGCCDVCSAMDGKHFRVDKMQSGLNAPPMHPNCRCSIAAWEDDEEYDAWLDYLSKGGTTAEWERRGKAAWLKKSGKAIDNPANGDIIKADTIDKAIEYAHEALGLEQVTAYHMGINVDVANGVNEAVYKIGETFGSLAKSGYLKNILINTGKTSAYAAYSPGTNYMFLNKSCKTKSALRKMAKDAAEEFDMGAWATGNAFHTVYHELGHAVQHMQLDNDAVKRNKINVLFNAASENVMGKDFRWSMDSKNEHDKIVQYCAAAKDAGFSYYGFRNSGEFVAESIAQYFLSEKPSEYAKQVVEILKGG